ncbi:hypothetical protein ON010_g6308 [Phytophthora cinnamomi]|nr:hypothetical protein ON010_g6308 [Phytophthora cinnamomi]
MSTLISDGATPPQINSEDPSLPRRINIRRPSSARASFMQQKLQTALSQAEKTAAELSQSSNLGQPEDSRVQGDFQVDRSIARYRSAASVVSYTDPATAFSYSTSFMPGVHFYTFLAAKEAAPARTARGLSSHSSSTSGINNVSGSGDNSSKFTARKQNLALKLNVPDTILYGETGRAVWIYTDKDGYVQRLTEFSDKQVLDKFADGTPAIADEQYLVVYKEPITTMTNQQNSTGVQVSPVFNSQGNQLRLLNLGEVKTLLNGVMAMHKSFALQQFVKCNGSKAFVQRAVYEAGKPPHAWMISNIEPFRDPSAPLSPSPGNTGPQTSPRPGMIRLSSSSTIATAGPDGPAGIPLVSRLCTSIQTDKACTFVKLTERGCAAISELNLRIVRYIEQRLRIALQTFVADFVKDAAGEWWLLQVKAFQVQNKVHPGRVFSLPLKLRMTYLNYRDTVILDEEDDENFDTDDRRNKARQRLHRRAIVPLSQRNIHKLVQCKCCLAAYRSSELSFKMTLKMINDMLLRIRSRLPPEKTLPFLSAAFARELPESAVAYESWSVCSYCYAIYERDQQLQRIETKFSAALGLPNTKTMADGLSRVQDPSYALDPTVSTSVIPAQLTLCRLILVINAIYDIPPELYNAEQENARIEAAADEVAAAEGRKRAQRASASRLYLRINALGYTECIPVNPDDIMEASEKAPVGARRRRDSSASSVSDDEDDEFRGDSDQSEPQSSRRQSSWQQLSRSQSSRLQQPPSNNDVNYWLPTNLIRTIPFFAPRTPLQSKLKETSGITPFLTEDNSVRVQLIRATEPPLQDPITSNARRRPKNRRAALVPAAGSMSDLVMQMHGPSHAIVLGSTKIRMTQFRSSYVTKIDYYACMAITGEMLNIKGNIGLERVRYVDSKLLTSQHRLRVYNGIFVPDESYTTGDALSSEWMDCFRATGSVVRKPSPIVPTAPEPVDIPKKTIMTQRRSTSSSQGSGKHRRVARPTSSSASLMDEDEEMDRELEQMIERANLKQQEAHFRQMGLRNGQASSNINEEDTKAASATAIKQELLRDSTGISAKSASQMAMLLNKPIISPRSELADCNGHEDNNVTPPASGTSMILPSPRNRKWMWSLVFLINQAHNLQSREPLERATGTSRTRSGTLSTSASADAISTHTVSPSSSHLEVQFNCTHKFWLAGTTLMVQAYLRNNPSLRLYFRNDMYASTRCESEGEYYGVLDLSKLLQTRGFDTTIDIIAAHDDPTITPREAATISRMSPYLSLSVQLSRASIDPDEAFVGNNKRTVLFASSHSHYELAAAGAHVRAPLGERREGPKTRQEGQDEEDEEGHSEEEEEKEVEPKHEKDSSTQERAALPRDEWMSMPFMRPEVEPVDQFKTQEELLAEAKQRKIQEEIDAGMREPVTGMVYGLYDPKNPDAAPAVSSKVVQGEEEEKEGRKEEEDTDMPLFGDGGASWRAKMLKRAQDRARASGVALEEVVGERFGSVNELRESARGSARENAHLQYKRHRVEEEKDGGTRRKLEIGRDAKDKTLLSKYSSRVQRSVTQNLEEEGRQSEGGRRYKDRNSTRRGNQDDEEDEPIDYDKLPDFEDRGGRTGASRRDDGYRTPKAQSQSKSQSRETRACKATTEIR